MTSPHDAFAVHTRPALARLLGALNLDVAYTGAAGDHLTPGPELAGRHPRVLDLVGGFGAGLFGHNHPELVAVATRMLAEGTPFNVQGSVRTGAAELARELGALAAESTGTEYVVTLGSTGAEAVEAAVKHAAAQWRRRLDHTLTDLQRALRRARRDGMAGTRVPLPDGTTRSCAQVLTESIAGIAEMRTAEPVFASLPGAFHGKTAAAGILTDSGDVPAALQVRGPRRIRLRTADPEALRSELDDELVTLSTIEFAADGSPRARELTVSSVAACFAEPVQGEGGVREVPAATLGALRELADRHGAALVFDEIQCGMGRTGTFFASEAGGVRADYYLLSKSLGGGLAKISALLVSATHYLDDFGRYHTGTFGDDDHSARIALAALALYRAERHRITETGERLRERLLEVAARRPGVITEVRGRGLLLGVEFAVPQPESNLLREFLHADRLGYVIAGRMLHTHGIRVLPTLSAPNTLRLQPSIYLSEDDCERTASAVDEIAELLSRGDYATLLEHVTLPRTGTWRPPVDAGSAARPRLGGTRVGSNASPPGADSGMSEDGSHRRVTAPASSAFGGRRRVAFLANLDHPGTVRSLAPELSAWSDEQCAAALDRLRGEVAPFEVARRVLTSPGHGEVEVSVIAVPVSATQVVEARRAGHGAWLRGLVLDAVEYAVAAGASVVGLGGYTSIVTDAARDVVEDRVRVTSGNSLTAACAYETLRAELAALPPGERRVGVVGALGNIGAVLAEMLAPHADCLVLTGRPGSAGRLRRFADRLSGPEIVIDESLEALRSCRVVVTASNSATPILTPEVLAGGHPVLVYDLAVPGDVDAAVAEMPNVAVVSGGRIRLPHRPAPRFAGIDLAPGLVYACMAETILLGFESDTDSMSFGALTVAGVYAAGALAARHRFQPVRLATSGEPTVIPVLPRFLGDPDFDPAVAGAKAATLHELRAAGFPVPPGFVVAPELDLAEHDDAALADWIDRLGGFPVAVRSSGVLEDLDDASFAGQYDTYLEVADMATLRQRIGDCRDSAHNDRVTSYLRRAGLDPARAAVSVLVQRQVHARTAGVGFTIDPLTGIEDDAVVECCAGLGERLVSGQVNPLRLRLRLRDGAVLDRTEGSGPVACDAEEAAALARLLLDVQAERGRPQDVEWAIDEAGELWLLQSRAITAISWREDVEQYTDADFRDGGVSARVCTPMMYSLYRNAFQSNMQDFFTTLRLQPEGEVPEWISSFYGRPYWNVDAVKRCLAKVPGFDERDFDRDLGVTKEYGAAGPDTTPSTPGTLARALPTAVAFPRSVKRQSATVATFATEWPGRYRRWQDRVAALRDIPDTEFFPQLAECLSEFHADTERTYFATIYHNTLVQGDFKTLLGKIDAATGATTSVIDLMSGLTEVSHMALQRGIVQLYRVADTAGLDTPEWDRTLAKFLAAQGFHADVELELTCPRWSEDPERVRSMIASMLAAGTPPADPEAGAAEQSRRYEAAVAALRERVRGSASTRIRFGKALDKQLTLVRRYLVDRERMREFSAQCYAVVRAYLVEAGRRLAADGRLADADEVFMLQMPELVEVARGRSELAGLAADLAYRRAMYRGYRALTPPHELGSGVTTTAAPGDGGEITGVGCSSGVVEGTARVVLSLRGIDELRQGDILVTPVTDPGWTPVLGLVSGVVTEVGGILSHAAVIGREYGIPAVLNVPDATSRIRSGQRIRVDGGRGTVEILDPGADPAGSTRPDIPAPQPLSAGKRMICVVGLDGAGKSTQIARLRSAFEEQGATVAEVAIWDALEASEVAAVQRFRDRGDVYRYLRVLSPWARTHFLFHALHLALDLAVAKGGDILLMDAYWYKYFATEVAHGGDPAVLRALAAGFPEPDHTFYLRISPEEALARKDDRSDYESGYGDDVDFVSFQERSHEILATLADELPWLPVDGTLPPDEITARLLDELREREQ
ncbi:aminotransferase class III-fold pyridoxal phosphate-dependent enzyme [Nocardia mexicana]|uniref:Acetylornithine/succinyldiaminopimelate/putresci ne aminotransferase n=1 Tax=Nocardia mexicana TaxID=279262 RepID=A0A370GMU6_9NOCA|nr:aminotransferase class III-fold pyridoxal phosphate-dependent enzyme [Nocardia mexicana]RDI44941.1 acetylornithine/succinyldiaminopimelate/putrescine aminotransferase [Nocardia mexicana]